MKLLLRLLLCSMLMAVRVLSQTVFLHEPFDSANFDKRGWYDNTSIALTTKEKHGDSGSCAEFLFLKGKTTPAGGSGMRHEFPATSEVYLSYWVKYSENYVGSGKAYHPHEFLFTTNLDSKYVGPAYTYTTLYIEHNNGYPLLAIQDAKNIDTTQIRKDISKTTEQRSCAGCNGSGDNYPEGDCYKSGNYWLNGKQWRSSVKAFDKSGMYNKNEWHHVEVYFRLNTISNGKGIADGVAQYWFDAEPLIDIHDALFRTAAQPTMKITQLLIAPYIGDGSPVEQTMWVDELLVANQRIGLTAVHDKDHALCTEQPSFTQDMLHIPCLVQGMPTTVRVFTLPGNMVAEFSLDGYGTDKEEAPMPSIASGVYIVSVQTATSKRFFTVMKRD